MNLYTSYIGFSILLRSDPMFSPLFRGPSARRPATSPTDVPGQEARALCYAPFVSDICPVRVFSASSAIPEPDR